MNLRDTGALVAGGASGLGAATARELHARGARVAVVDIDAERAKATAETLGSEARWFQADVTDADAVEAAVAGAVEAFGSIGFAASCAGIGWAERVVGRDGPAQLQPFETVVRVNLIGTFNVLRLTATAMASNDPGEDGERGALVMTASIAAYEGQIGQTAYSASKGGVVGLTLPAARDLARLGIRVVTIAPGLFDTPLLARAAGGVAHQAGRAGAVPVPAREAGGVRGPRLPHRGEPHAERRGHQARRRAAHAAEVTVRCLLPAAGRRLCLGQRGALGHAHRLGEVEMRTADSTSAAIRAAAGRTRPSRTCVSCIVTPNDSGPGLGIPAVRASMPSYSTTPLSP